MDQEKSNEYITLSNRKPRIANGENIIECKQYNIMEMKKIWKVTWNDNTGQQKLFLKARNFRSLLGYIGVTESENALSFAELALVFNKIFSLGAIFYGIWIPNQNFCGKLVLSWKSRSYNGPIFHGILFR